MLTTNPSIAAILSNELHTRDQADLLFSMIESDFPACNHFVLDFSEVQYMSRSFADQFHKLKLAWSKQKETSIIAENLAPQCLDMLRAVAQTQKVNNRTSADIPVYSFSNPQKLFELLQSI